MRKEQEDDSMGSGERTRDFMNFYEKICNASVEIPEKFDLTVMQIADIQNHAPDMFHAISVAFQFGYIQGRKALDAELRKVPEKAPKYKSELRQAVYFHTTQIKNIFVLKELLKLADINRRRYDDVEYKSVSDLENYKASLVSSVLGCEDEAAIKDVHTFVSVYLSKSRKKRATA